FKWLMSSCVVLMLTVSLISCGGSDSPAATGTLNIKLTDAATSHQAVYVTINEVHVHHETGGWVTLPELDLPQTVNLLELVNGVMLDLGIAELEAGHYNQMRLILEDSEGSPEPQDPPDNNILGLPHPSFNYLIDANNEDFPLKVPSGGNTGIKLVNGFDIVADRANELVLDFDAHRSIVEKGNGNFGLKPTIKVLETVDNTVIGTVDREEDNTPLGGALVSAQVYNPDAEDLRDEVFVESTTETAPDGTYTLLLPLNTYNIVATATGYLPACQVLEAEWYFDNDDADFTLTLADEIRSINVTVAGMDTEEDTALLSFRQTQKCGEGDVMIEVASMNVTNGVYPISLPAGTYDVVASAVGKMTQEEKGINVDRDLTFDFKK
ncbi:MAG TPA: DUF4382 domain-containing protein, partial [Desulfobulbales bacterium]|nr:DUF4382 domain-containing protein [Desulfobulbales bacterium]